MGESEEQETARREAQMPERQGTTGVLSARAQRAGEAEARAGVRYSFHSPNLTWQGGHWGRASKAFALGAIFNKTQ